MKLILHMKKSVTLFGRKLSYGNSGPRGYYIGNVGGSYLVMALACHIVPVFFLVLNFLVELTLLITKSCSTLKFLSIYSRELFRLNALFLVFEFFKVRRSRIGTKSYP